MLGAKSLLVFALALLCVGARVASVEARGVSISGLKVTPVTSVAGISIAPPKPAESAPLCSVCVSFMGDMLQILLNIIAENGVMGNCGKLCGLLPTKLENDVCSILCDIVGIDEFVKIIGEVDPDPVSMCMNDFHVCPIVNTGSAQIVSLQVTPQQGKRGTTFTIAMTYQVLNMTGTGTVEVEVIPPGSSSSSGTGSSTYDGQPFGSSELTVYQMPGFYQVGFQLQAKPAEGEPFLPGTYGVVAAVCEGTCGSTHKNSQVYSEQQTSFKIVAKGGGSSSSSSSSPSSSSPTSSSSTSSSPSTY